jgi:enoyl-CoA hydratase/carnithine racemase
MLDPGAYRTIDVTLDGSTGVAVLTLNRPDKANAVDDVMHSELSTVFAAAQDDGRVPLSLALEAAAMEHDGFRAAMEKLGRK